jgi:lysozyme
MSDKAQVVVKFGVPLILASASLMALLGRWELDTKDPGRVYVDTLSRAKVLTVCKGITPAVSPYPLVLGDYWSEEKCAEVERMATEKTQLRLLDCVRVPISQNTFDAFSSHAHNFGVKATCASRALELVNRGQLAAGCDAIAHAQDGKTPVWSYSDGKYYRGLYSRRLDERSLCLKR